jgi:hypothetical protein
MNSNIPMRGLSQPASHWCSISHFGPASGSWYMDVYNLLSWGSLLLYHWDLLESIGWGGYV